MTSDLFSVAVVSHHFKESVMKSVKSFKNSAFKKLGFIAFGLAISLGGLQNVAAQGAVQTQAATASNSDSQTGQDLLRKGYDAIKQKNYLQAEDLLNKARVKLPENPYVLLNLGVVYQNTNRQAEAVKLYQQTFLQ